jgi:SSS family solute:Na+ symporter
MDQQLAAITQGTNFSNLDWGIVVVYLLISVAIGIIANRFIGNMSDYVVAGRGVRTALGIATLTGTELGLVTVMYSAQKGFTGGFAAFHIAVVAGVVTFFVGATGFILAALRRHQVLTIPEFYGKRFGPKTRILGGVILTFAGILNMGMFLKAGAMFIVGITGLDPSGFALEAIMVGLLALVLFYTVLGGMVSVILTDYIQFVVLAFGLLLTTFLALNQVGWETLVTVVQEQKGDAGFNPFKDETFGVEYVSWMAFVGLIGCCVWPTSVARALACDSESTVKKQFMFSSLSYTVRFIVPHFWGICAFVLITQTAELSAVFLSSEAEAADSLYAMPVYLGRLLPIGIIGIITAAMIAAFMSTHDSYLLCWSSVMTNDVVVPMTGNTMPQKTQILWTRVWIVLFGAAVLYISMYLPLLEDLWDYMAATGAIYFTGAFALLVGGLYWKRASSTGACLALLSGLLAFLSVGAVQQKVFGLFVSDAEKIKGLMATFTGDRINLCVVVLALTAMVVGSLLFPDPPHESDAEEATA